jgi:hypothetical protein
MLAFDNKNLIDREHSTYTAADNDRLRDAAAERGSLDYTERNLAASDAYLILYVDENLHSSTLKHKTD